MPIRIQYTFDDAEPTPPPILNNSRDADPQVIGEAIAKISADSGGRLKPRAVWKSASPSRHPLHKFFEWNNQVAAELHRDAQARAMIRCIRIVDDSHEEPRRAFISIRDTNGTAYRGLDEVLSSRDLQLALMQAAGRDLDAWVHRYQSLSDICSMIRVARRQLDDEITAKINKKGGGRPELRPE